MLMTYPATGCTVNVRDESVPKYQAAGFVPVVLEKAEPELELEKPKATPKRRKKSSTE